MRPFSFAFFAPIFAFSFLSLAGCGGGLRPELLGGTATYVATADGQPVTKVFPVVVALCDPPRKGRAARSIVVRFPNRCDLRATVDRSRFGTYAIIDPGQTCILPVGDGMESVRTRDGAINLTVATRPAGAPRYVAQLDLTLGADTLEAQSHYVSYRFTAMSHGEASEDICLDP